MIGRRTVVVLLVLAGCRPDIRTVPAPNTTLLLDSKPIVVHYLRSDPARRHPTVDRTPLQDGEGILIGYAHERLIHVWPEGTACGFDVLFLSNNGQVRETQSFDPYFEPGVTSRTLAHYALLLPRGWATRHLTAPPTQAIFGPEILAAPPDPLQEIHLGGLSLRVEISYRTAERARGLMYRPALSPGEGMLFIYRTAARRSYWMLHCYFPLDVAHFSEERKLLNVVSIDPNRDPAIDTGERAVSQGDAQFVLEVPKGWFQKRGLVDPNGFPVQEVVLQLPDSVAALLPYAD